MTPTDLDEQLREVLLPEPADDPDDALLRVDSLTWIEVSCILDEAGVDLPDELRSGLRTVGDLVHYATLALERGADAKSQR